MTAPSRTSDPAAARAALEARSRQTGFGVAMPTNGAGAVSGEGAPGAAAAGPVWSPPMPVATAPATSATAALSKNPPASVPPPVTSPPPSKNCSSEDGRGTTASERIAEAFRRKLFRARKMSVSTAETDTPIVSEISA